MTPERSPDHNFDVAIELHLTSVEHHLGLAEARSSKGCDQIQRIVLESTLGALRELQLWTRDLSVDVSTASATSVDGRLRRLEAAAAADDLAIDDLRDLIEELRIEVDALLKIRDSPGR